MADGTIKIAVELDTSKAQADADKAGKGLGDAFGKGTEEGSERATSALGKIGDVAGKVATVGAAAMGALTTAVGAIGTSALGAYGQYEQLVGGVDKLFGDASGKLQAYADQAYKTSGLSANQYMTQVTSFSASLISSLGGDTSKAADYANLAMTTMADNVNVFGSNMSDVQNAFQGFAKQNYTMLDNLKLGYGGTKSEMQRLIEHANTLPGVMKEGNDLSINSFADVVEAIARVQQEQKIAGTTAKEASGTIEGSIAQAKAAWENFLTALGTGDTSKISETTTQLLDSIGAVAQNVIPRMAVIGDAMVQALPGIVEKVGTVLGPLLATALSTAWNIAVQGLSGLGIPLPQINPEQVEGAFDRIAAAIRLVGDTAQQLSPYIAPVVGAIGGLAIAASVAPGLMSLANGFKALSGITSVASAIGMIAPALAGISAPVVIAVGALAIFAGVVGGLLATNDQFRDSVVQAFQGTLPMLQGAFQGLQTAAQPFLDAIGQLVSTLGSILMPIITTVAQFIASIIPPAIALVVTVITQVMAILTPLIGILTTVVGIIGSVVVPIIQVVVAIIQGVLIAALTIVIGIVTAVGTVFSSIFTAIQSVVTTVVNAIVTFFTSTLPAGFATFISVVSQLPGQVMGFLSGLLSSIAGWVGDMVSKAVECGSRFLQSISDGFGRVVSFMSQVPGRIISAISALVNDLMDLGGRAMNGMRDGLSNAFGAVVGFVTGIPGNIVNALGDVGGLLVDAGKAIIDGLLSGIKSAVGGVIDFVSGIAGQIAEHKGPIPYDLKLLIPNGQAIMRSLATGLKRGLPDVLDVVDGIAPQLQVTAAGAGTSAVRSYQSQPTSQTVNRAGDTYNFYQPVKTPAQTAREIRMQQTYGLAGAR